MLPTYYPIPDTDRGPLCTRRADSFNGWTGHVLAAFSLLYLAQLTQRVAILWVALPPVELASEHSFRRAAFRTNALALSRAARVSETSFTTATR